MDELAVGLLGCGGMARHLAREAAQIPGVRIAAVCDANAALAEETGRGYDAPWFDNHRALLNVEGIGAVIIGVPNSLHAPLTVDSANAGKHVFCEKPMATTLEDCDRMIAATADNGVQLMIGQVLRYYPTFQRVLERVRAGAIGEPRAAHVVRTGGPGTFSSGWRSRFSDCGGLLMEVNAHELDFLGTLLGRAGTVYASAQKIVPGPPDFDDLLFTQIGFHSGAQGFLYASSAMPLGEHRLTVQGTQGGLTSDGFGGSIRLKQMGGEVEEEPAGEITAEEPYRHELRLFVEAVRENRPPPVTGQDGRAAVELALAAYQSARTGAVVRLPLA